MPSFLLHHRHTGAECSAAFAAWSGFTSPLRHGSAASTCLAGGHTILWCVEADSEEAALALLPDFVRERTAVEGVRQVEIP